MIRLNRRELTAFVVTCRHEIRRGLRAVVGDGRACCAGAERAEGWRVGVACEVIVETENLLEGEAWIRRRFGKLSHIHICELVGSGENPVHLVWRSSDERRAWRTDVDCEADGTDIQLAQ